MVQVLSNLATILGSLTKLDEYTPLATDRSNEYNSLTADRGEYETLGKASEKKRPPPTTQPALATSSPLYKKIVLGIFVLIVVFAGTLVLLGLFGDAQSKLLTSAFDHIADGLKVCIGAFVGLIGGKAVTD